MAKNWIAKATKNKGGLHRMMGIPMDKAINKHELAAATHAPGKKGKAARLAVTLMTFHKKGK